MAIVKLLMQACAVALLLASAVPAQAQSREVVDAPADYRHKATGTVLPATVGPFVRTKVTEYNDAGSDASASYDLILNGQKLASVTIYVYPMDGTGSAADTAGRCTDEFAGIKTAVNNAYRNVNVVAEDTPGSPSPRVTALGKHARFSFEGGFAGTTMVLRSEAFLYCPSAGKWFVQYRASWPASRNVESDMFAFMSGLPWSDVLRR